MKVGLNFGETIMGKHYPAGSVIDIFEPDALALIEKGRAAAVKDGTMARKKAYGVPGCMPPAGFMGVNMPESAQNNSIAPQHKKKQKTNTLKR